ncbi:MAG: hypothetical protein NC131_04015 [Roseburia sp.]|nr:hypothetical protein [Roseburia sp.]
MNKLTKLLSVFVIAGALGAGVAGISACKGGDSTPKHEHKYTYTLDETDKTKHNGHCAEDGCDAPDINEEHHWNDQNKCKECNATKPSGEGENPEEKPGEKPEEKPSEEEKDLTADTWGKAFELGEKFAYDQTLTIASVGEVNMHVEIDGVKFYVETSAGSVAVKFYAEKDGAKTYLYSKTYEYWSKTETDGSEVGGVNLEELTEIAGLDSYFPFDKFEKGEKAGEYVAKESYTIQVPDGEDGTMNVTVSEATLGFKNGKIASVDYTFNGQRIAVTFDYTKSVTLPVALVGEQVTAQEFTQALKLADSNYRMNVNIMGMYSAVEYKQDGLKKSFTTLSDPYNMEYTTIYMNWSDDDGKAYGYDEMYGHWFKSETPIPSKEVYQAYNGLVAGEFTIDLSDYTLDEFTWEPVSKSYTMTNSIQSITATFKDKKLVSATVVDLYEQIVYFAEFVYGDAVVEIPTIPDGEEVNETQWNAAKKMEYDNFEITVVSTQYGTITFKKAGDIVFQQVENDDASAMMSSYAVKDGDKYYMYEPKEGIWTKSEIDADKYNSMTPEGMLSMFDYAKFTYDSENKIYAGLADMDETPTQARIKFVDGKFDIISVSQTQDVFFVYGGVEITLPAEGSPATGGSTSGGGDVEGPTVSTKKDIDEKEWLSAFEAIENAPAIAISGDGVQFIIDREQGYVFQGFNEDESNNRIYSLEDGVLYMYTYNDDGIYREPVENGLTWDEIIERIYVIAFTNNDPNNNVEDMFEQFGGQHGNYYCMVSDSEQIGVQIENGAVRAINYNGAFFAFDTENVYAPWWYDEYARMHVSEEQWNKAFALDCEQFIMQGRLGEQSFNYGKDGDNYMINIDGEMAFYGKEGERYFEYSSEDGWVTFTKTEIDEAEYAERTQLPPVFEMLRYGEFIFNDESYSYEHNDSRVVFEYKKLLQVTTESCDFGFTYGEPLTMPTEKMNEAEWSAAIGETLKATNLTFTGSHLSDGDMQSGYTNYIDLKSGLIYREASGKTDNDLVYVDEAGSVNLYTGGSDGFISKTDGGYILSELYNNLIAEILTPEILGGQTLADCYSDFEYRGFGQYIYNNIGGDPDTFIEVTFNNGKIESVVTGSSSDGGYLNDDYRFFNYGTTDGESRLPWWYWEMNNNKGDKD